MYTMCEYVCMCVRVCMCVCVEHGPSSTKKILHAEELNKCYYEKKSSMLGSRSQAHKKNVKY